MRERSCAGAAPPPSATVFRFPLGDALRGCVEGVSPAAGPFGAGAEPARATFSETFVMTFPFLSTTSFRSMLIEMISTASLLSPTPRIGFNIGLPGPGTISNSASGVDRMLVSPVSSTVASGTNGIEGVGTGSAAGKLGFRLNGFLSTIHS